MSAKRDGLGAVRPGSKPAKGDGPKCPICGRPRVPEFQPFCSRRCADADLSRWLSGTYVIPGHPIENDED